MVSENIDVTVDLKDRLSQPAERAEDSLEDLRGEVNKLSAALAANEVAAKRDARALAALRSAARMEREETKRATAEKRRQNEETRSAAKALAVLRKETAKNRTGFLGLSQAMKLLKFQAIIALVTYLATGLSALGAAAYAAIAGLSPLVGLLGLMPGVLFGVVAGFAAVKVGTKGVGDAFTALMDGSDPQKVAEAMNKLTGEGRALAVEMSSLAKGPLRAIRRSTQSAIAPGMLAGLQEMRPLLPVINARLTATAGVMGDLAARAGEVSGTGWFRGQVARIMKSNNVVLENGAEAGGFLLLALLDIADAARPVTENMMQSARAVSEFLADATEAGRQSGGLTAFLRRSWELAKDVGDVLADTGVVLYNIGAQSEAAGDLMGGGIVAKMRELRDYTSSVTGQASIRQWFEDALPVMQAFADLTGGILIGFANLATDASLAPVIDQITNQLLPAFGDMSTTIASDIGPALVDAATAAVQFIGVLSSSPVPDILGAIASALLAVTSSIEALPGPVKTALTLVLALGFAFRALAFLSGTARLALGKDMVGALGQIRSGFQQGSQGIGTFNRALGGVMGAAGGAKRAAAGLVGALGGPWGIALAAATFGLGKWMQSQQEAKARVESLSASIDGQTGALDKVGRAAVAKALEDAGALKAAESFGIALDDVTNAALGNEAALGRVNAATSEATDLIRLMANDPLMELSSAQNEVLGRYNTLNVAIKGQNKEVAEATSMAGRLAEANSNAGAATGDFASNATVAERALNGQADAADRTRGALAALNAELVSQQRTYIGFRQNVDDATKTLKEGKLTLDPYTQAGRDNASALLDVAEAAAQVTDKAQRTQAIKEARQIIRDWGKQAGMSAAEAQQYSRDLFSLGEKAKALPREAVINVYAFGVEAANAAMREAEAGAQRLLDKIGRFRGQLASVPLTGPVVNAAVEATTPSTVVPPRPNTGGGRGQQRRRDGGPVWAGEAFRVGEVGPELLVQASGVSVIGLAGEANMHFAEPGYVLPNEAYRDAVAARPGVEAPVPAYAAARGGDSGGTAVADGPTHFHNHFHGPVGAGITVEDIEAATQRAIDKRDREKKERR